MGIGKRKKRRKKKAKKKLPKKKTGGGKLRPALDHTKDPVYKLKPNDIVRYTHIDEEGEKSDPELHLILEYPYARDKDRVSDHPTLQLKDGNLCATTLYCWGKDACKIENLTATHKLECSFLNGKSVWKLSKQRIRKKKV